MDDIVAYFKNKKNLISLLVLAILILAIPLTVQLVRQQQIIKSRAVEAEVEIVDGPHVLPGTPKKLKPDNDGNYKVEVRITSPFGPP